VKKVQQMSEKQLEREQQNMDRWDKLQARIESVQARRYAYCKIRSLLTGAHHERTFAQRAACARASTTARADHAAA
jgi:hypothetical protein